MKRFFALALVLCIALSMMVMTASAVDISCNSEPDHNVSYVCNNPDHIEHYYVIAPVPGDTDKFRVCWTGSAGTHWHYDHFYGGTKWGDAQFEQGKVYAVTSDKTVYCGTPGASQPQPKTGVEDTLPLWFGVMAVSACAYVLTSKKKFF